MPMTPPAAVIVLAAGEGTRMKSASPKVLHQVCGRSLVGHVVTTARSVGAEQVIVVLGHGRDQVGAHLAADFPDVITTVQEQQNGTGHAVRTALEQLDDRGIGLGPGAVAVVAGDAPLLTPETLGQLVAEHESAAAAVTVLSAILADPTGYGRILRDPAGLVTGIVEHKDATPEQQSVAEVNSGMYVFAGDFLADGVQRLTTDNVQGEEYLTDLVAMARADGRLVAALAAPDPDDTLGINDRAQLAQVEAIMRARTNVRWMRAGVTMRDPATTYIDVGVDLAPDCVLEPGTILRGATTVGAGAVVGPDSTLIDTVVGAGARVNRVHSELADIGPDATVGPFTFLRPAADLAAGAKAGAFVEIKNATVGEGAKVPHLTYVGDAEIGAGANIGASSVFVNYDGMAKHRTVVGREARVGSDTMLVAPVVVGPGAYTAAGSVIVEDVPAGALAIARGRQRNIEGWVAANRSGSAAAEAAADAEGE
ncbi:MAG: bifunctional UDP-N-acetylglucosamine diphosphorylase/glucosamine-1-phosphate N-acetyltransferase GlmU [Candidatus Nanopelagicales bacterium]